MKTQSYALPYQKKIRGTLIRQTLYQLFFTPIHYLYPTCFLMTTLPFVHGLYSIAFLFFCASTRVGIQKLPLFGTTFLGAILFNGPLNASYFVTSVMLFFVLNRSLKFAKITHPLLFSLHVTTCIIVSEILRVILQKHELLLAGWFMSILGYFILSLILYVAFPPLRSRHELKNLSLELFFVLSMILLFLIYVAFAQLPYGENLSRIFSLLAILLFSYARGYMVAITSSVWIWILHKIFYPIAPSLIEELLLISILAGLFKWHGKVGITIGFVMGIVCTRSSFLIDLLQITESSIKWFEPSSALILFWTLPKSFYAKFISSPADVVYSRKNDPYHLAKTKEDSARHLIRFTQVFEELSRTFYPEKFTIFHSGREELNALIDKVADKSCKNCYLRSYCWEKNFYSTYQSSIQMFEKLEDTGKLSTEDVPISFLNKCQRVPQYLQAMNDIYENHKVNTLWKNQFAESQSLFLQQLKNISKMVSQLTDALSKDIHFEPQQEESLLRYLNDNGIHITEITIQTDQFNKREINLFHKHSLGARPCSNILEKSVSHFFKKQFVKKFHSCAFNTNANLYQLTLVEEKSFGVLTGIAKMGKGKSRISGDHYTIFHRSDGVMVLALSDGMGSGLRASKYSEMTIHLLEQLLDTEFDIQTSLELINSTIAFKTAEDQFSTLDLFMIDLYSGKADFYKVGAVPTFVKSKDTVQIVHNFSLPIGILSDIDVDHTEKNLSDGDFVIMISDGILEGFQPQKNTPQTSQAESSFQNYLKTIQSKNPQEIADNILSTCFTRLNKVATDDMMVLVTKIWKKTN